MTEMRQILSITAFLKRKYMIYN